MGRLIFGMMQSLDGYIDGPAGNIQLGPPGPILSRHFNDYVRGSAGFLYGRRIYEVMRYWEQDQPDWDEGDQKFAQIWRSKYRDDALRNQVMSDVHSPPYYRVNGELPNLDAWYTAFDVKPGDKLYVPPGKRVRIW